MQAMHYIYIYKRLRTRKKNPQQKKERATETLNLKLNTKPLKFKCGLTDGIGGGGWSTHARHEYPHLVFNEKGNKGSLMGHTKKCLKKVWFGLP